MPTTLLALPWVEPSYAELDVERRTLRSLDVPAAEVERGPRPADAVFQRYGRTWLAMARRPDGLALVTPDLVVPLPIEPPATTVGWRRRLLWAELSVAHRTFRYRRPAATVGTSNLHAGIQDDFAFWVYWRLRESLGLRDWVANPDWRVHEAPTAPR